MEALGELPGVGPATLEQLRTALDFSDKGGKAGNGSRPGRRGAEQDDKEAAERGARGGPTARFGAEAARGAAEASAQATTTAARSGLQLVERTAGTFGEVQRETARRSAEGTAELGQLLAEFVSEQTRHNLEVATAFGRSRLG